MRLLRKLVTWGLLLVGGGITAFGLYQTGRVTWAMLHPPPPGAVFEPLIPLIASVFFVLVGMAVLAVAGAFSPVTTDG
ncbi:hypothetical protein MNR01_12430 [Lysobacter sp. S4-A87]|uniref:hypothetical protein n=1 Tax=Lysobacter sp. S4-A87 TaxID=2925843 RepID=UPI001F53550C|nr:hypothetical protein [Lysobacter sp. S4-A87]UNK48552.1 hypothetical protein MNR01_12430 [Lysobacter sp. S4-A87]